MKKLFDDVITNITNLIMLRQQQIALLQTLSRNTDAIPLSFKIKNYLGIPTFCVNSVDCLMD